MNHEEGLTFPMSKSTMVAQNKRIKTSERCQRPPGRPEEKIVAAATVREIKPPALEEYQCKTGAAATE